MRNFKWKSLIAIALIVALSVVSLLFQRIDLGVGDTRFQRGSDSILGLQLGLDLAGGAHLVYQAGDEQLIPNQDQMEGLLRIIRQRVDSLGTSEPNTQKLGETRILVQLPGIQDAERAKRLIGQTASLEFFERVCADRVCSMFEDRATGLTGEDLVTAFASQDRTTAESIVQFEMKRDSVRSFAELTQRIFDSNGTDSPDQLAVFLDEIKQVSAAVSAPILTGNGLIRGNYTPESARDLAISLESGRLPIDIHIVTERVVDASLGSGSLERSLVAGAVGLALVLFFMMAYYRGAGMVAAFALVFYTAIVLAIFKLLPVTLTLAGVAGFILSMGMAVDANILIFERMKEELRVGRSLNLAIQIGFQRAWPSIRDGNLSTFIISAILYWFGTTFAAFAVTGLAVALFIGVATSMFSAIFISRNLLAVLAGSPLRRFPNLFSPERLQVRSREMGRSGQSTL